VEEFGEHVVFLDTIFSAVDLVEKLQEYKNVEDVSQMS